MLFKQIQRRSKRVRASGRGSWARSVSLASKETARPDLVAETSQCGPSISQKVRVISTWEEGSGRSTETDTEGMQTGQVRGLDCILSAN